MTELIQYNKHNEFLVEFNFEITLKCNNRCEYCYALDYLDNNTTINKDVFYETIKQINKFHRENPEYKIVVGVLGGEPLLVKKQLIEFIEALDDDIYIDVYANLNYKGTHLLGLEKYKNVKITCSWHVSSDPDFIKYNIENYPGQIEIAFFLNGENTKEMVEHVKWAYEKDIEYRVESIRDHNQQHYPHAFQDYDSEEYKFFHQTSREIRRGHFIRRGEWQEEDTDLGLNPDEVRRVSSYFHTICKINQYHISFDGTVSPPCQYPGKYHISEGLQIVRTYCKGWDCICESFAYKQLRPKT